MNFIENVRTWNRARQTRAELKTLSDRQLDDIGIGCHGINAVARNPHFS